MRKSRPSPAANSSTRVPLHNFLLCGLCWTVNLLFIAAVILKSWYINFVKERENLAAELIKRALPENLRGRFTLIDATDEPVARVALHEGSLDFIPIWAGEGFPKDVEAALAVNARAVAQRPEHVVVTARRLSSGARALLEGRRISWTDGTGDAHIEAPPAFLIVREHDAVRRQRVHPLFRWAASTGALAEYLLAGLTQDPGSLPPSSDGHTAVRIPPSGQLADVIAWSPGQVSKCLQGFDGQGWTVKTGPTRGRGAGREFVDPGAMLTSWGVWYAQRANQCQGAHGLWRDVDDFVRQHLQGALVDGEWAVSGWLALAQTAPFATDVPNLTCYLAAEVYDDELDRLMSDLELRRVSAGPRVTFVRAEPQVLAQRRDEKGLPLVSKIRLFGDLLKAGARGADAADHLRESSIGF